MIPLNALTTLWTLVPHAEDIPDPNDVKPGWLGFVVVVGLGVAVVVLLLSFRKQLRKVDFPQRQEQPQDQPQDASPESGPKGESAEKTDSAEKNGGADRP